MHQAHQGVQRKVHLDKVPFQDMSQPQNYHQPLLKGRFIHIVVFVFSLKNDTGLTKNDTPVELS